MIRKPTKALKKTLPQFDPIRHKRISAAPKGIVLPVVPYIKIQNKLRVVCHPEFAQTWDAVKKMCETLEFEGYSDEILYLGYNIGESFEQFKSRHIDDKIICYQLEQICGKTLWYDEAAAGVIKLRTDHAKKWLKNCYEIWDYDLDNILFLQSRGYENAKFRPMQWFEGIKTIEHATHKDIDILFYGSMNQKRMKHLEQLSGFKLKIVTQAQPAWGRELDNLISRSKIILNLHYYDSHLQEQVRILPLIGNDCCVLSEKSRYNYFGNLITEFEGNELVPKVKELLGNFDRTGNSERFKNRKYRVGVCYNTFYGLEQIQSSIDSVYPIIDYIVIVHQCKGFDGQNESEETKRLIAELQKKYTVVIYSGNEGVHDGVISKRNIGLEHCKRAGCDFVIPLDTDEEYDCAALRKDLDRMWDEGIETLYSPIRTFYYDRKHYFEENYYVGTVYRINGRKFDNSPISLLTDPARKMKEGKYLVSESPMKHYSYMRETYDYKIKNHVMKGSFAEKFQQAYNYMVNWNDSRPALVFRTTDNGIQLVEMPVQKC